MSQYNHDSASLDDATGLSVKEVLTKAEGIFNTLVQTEEFSISRHIEEVENSLTLREAALVIGVLTRELSNKEKVLDLLLTGPFTSVVKEIPGNIKDKIDAIMADECGCEECSKAKQTKVIPLSKGGDA